MAAPAQIILGDSGFLSSASGHDTAAVSGPDVSQFGGFFIPAERLFQIARLTQLAVLVDFPQAHGRLPGTSLSGLLVPCDGQRRILREHTFPALVELGQKARRFAVLLLR